MTHIPVYVASIILFVAIVGFTVARSGYRAASSLVTFSFIWLLAFPLRTFLLLELSIPVQAPEKAAPANLSTALLLSCAFLIAVASGYFVCTKIDRKLPQHLAEPIYNEQLFLRVAALMIISALLSIFVSFDYGFDGTTYVEKLYGSAMSYRPGNGWYFFLAEMATSATIILFAWASITSRVRHKWLFLLLLSVAAVASLAMMFFLNTRRPVAYFMLLVILVAAIRMPKLRILIPIALVASLLGGQILQIARFSCVACLFTDSQAVGVKPDEVADPRSSAELFNVVVVTSSSYEGVDHLAMWLERTTWTEKLTGVDYGVSWIFNAALSLVPRGFWTSKPLVYGSVAQQAFLYPDMFTTPNYATLPPSFIVDFSYGLGIPFGLLAAFALGIGLRKLDRALFESTGFFYRAVGMYVFINMFNVIRSGTGIIQGIILFGLVCMAVALPLKLPFGRKQNANS